MKFYQGLAGLLTLLFPFAAAVTDCDRIVTDWGEDLTPCPPDELEDDGNRRDRALEQMQIQHLLPTGRRQLLTEDDFCNGTPITRTVECDKDDIIDLELTVGTTYTIDVQRVNCVRMDPSSFLFEPGTTDPRRSTRTNPAPGLVAKSNDFGKENLPAVCLRTTRFGTDPLIKYRVDQSGTFKLLTGSTTDKTGVRACPLPRSATDKYMLEYKVFISCTNCGNGVEEGNEECDDNNNFNDDSCTATCRQPDTVVAASFVDPPLAAGFVENRDASFVENRDGGANGDPHFKTWNGKHFDFHGVCDLVLLQNKEFESGLGLDVHIRTHKRRDMSYISSAALRIGTDVLEVESQGVYYFNGLAGADLPSQFGGFQFLHSQPTDKQHVFEIYLGGRERVKIKTYKDFVSVLFEQAQGKHFANAVGLMGDFGMGHMISRDGKTVMTDANAFGQEWQVLDTESSLFQSVRFPQHPSVCTMPTPIQASQLRRRLSEQSKGAELAAEKACEHWGEGKDDCVFDVLATGDLEMAVGGAY
jgi:cysteine-rich repeat protein